MIGTVVEEVSFTVEEGKVAEFHRAVGAQVTSTVPLTFTTVAGHWRDQAKMVQTLDLDIRRVVVGGTEWEYLEPVRIGDRLRGARVLTALEEKRGMRFLTLETRFTRVADGVELVIQRDTIIETAPV